MKTKTTTISSEDNFTDKLTELYDLNVEISELSAKYTSKVSRFLSMVSELPEPSSSPWLDAQIEKFSSMIAGLPEPLRSKLVKLRSDQTKTNAPPNGTYWIDSAQIAARAKVFRLHSDETTTNWLPCNFHTFLSAPQDDDNHDDGDWGFDYSTLNGTLIFRAGGCWYPATNENVLARSGATRPLIVEFSFPMPFKDASPGDFWFKPGIAVWMYSAAEGEWKPQPVIYASPDNPPDPIISTIWEDHTQLAATGARPLQLGYGGGFLTLPVFIQPGPPSGE